MKISNHCKTLITASVLLSASLPASASLYEIVCVECSLTESAYTLQSSNGIIDSGPAVFPNIYNDFDFQILGKTATAYNSSFYYNPGIYTFNSGGDVVSPPQNISMTVNNGQIGMFFQFEWNGNTDIDVLNVFDVSYNSNGDMVLMPTDVDGNGIAGFSMVEGPFLGLDLAMNFTVATPVPAAFWLFGSGLLGLMHIARGRKTA